MVNIAHINNTKKPNYWLWIILFIAVALTIWTALNDKSESENDLLESKYVHNQNLISARKTSTDRKTVLLTTQKDNVVIPWDSLNRKALLDKSNNLFNVHSWENEVAPAKRYSKPLPPPPPVAPPAPFTYMGKMEDGPKGTLIFLLSNNKVYSVSKGEKINAFWQLDDETETSLKMTYLPLNLPQIIYKNKSNTSVPSATRTMEMNQ